MVSYQNIAIKEIGDVVTGKTPPTANKNYYDGEYMFISPTELHGEYAITKSAKTITQAGLNSVRNNSIKGTSVLVGCIGWDMGNVGMCFEECATNQQINSITNIKEFCNPYYLYYWLRGKKDYLFSIASVTRTPILSKGTFEDVKVPLPNRDYQDSVAQVLNVIDSKISLNMKINDNLQQMAYTKYMHMFYDKTPNSKLGDVIIEHSKSVIQVGEAKEQSGNIPFFTSGDAIYRWTEAFVSDRSIFLNTGGNADVKFYVGDAAYSTDTWCISGENNLSDYVYLMLNSIKPELDQKFFQGTGLKHLQKPLLKDRLIYVPTHNELMAFNADIQPWLSMISDNVRESEELATIRDWLLPMLMNGQAIVSE